MRTTEEISHTMRLVRSRDTAPELTFRNALWQHGVRYRLGGRGLPGSPDLVFNDRKLVIFIDGDYWHGNQWYQRGFASLKEQMLRVHHGDYWISKITRNVERDIRVTAELLANGWKVIRFWESDIQTRLDDCVKVTLEALNDGEGMMWPGFLPSRTFAEFFAGIGLVRFALERAGWRGVFANDIDPQKREMYRANFPSDPEGHLSPDDIHKLPSEAVPSVALATASFPCNDLSVAGARKGLSGCQSSTFWGFTRILHEMGDRKPPLVLLENVVGFLTSHRGKDFQEALATLNQLGYACDAFIIDAARFVPQSRQRLFVVGVLAKPDAGENIYDSLEASDIRPQQLIHFILRHPEISWYIRTLPSLPHRTTTIEDIIENVPKDDPIWWSEYRCSYLLSQMSERHARTAQLMIMGDKVSHGTVFRRVRHGRSMAELRVDGLAGCLRTPRGGSGRQILFEAGQEQYRCRLLTPRECARLQGVPDSYRVDFPLNQALFGFGDAVCVPVIEWIARNYLNPVINELMRMTILVPPTKIER